MKSGEKGLTRAVLCVVAFAAVAAADMVDQSQPTNNTAAALNCQNYPNIYIAQTFTAGVTGDLTKVGTQIFVNGTTANLYITNVTGGLPNLNSKLGSYTLTTNQTLASPFVLPVPIGITATTQYAIVMGCGSGAASVGWGGDSNNSYAAGQAYLTSDGGNSWSNAQLQDFSFQTWFQSPSTVTNTNDSGPGSLRQAIFDTAPGGTITFSLPPGSTPNGITQTLQTIFLGSTLSISKNLTIAGPGARSLTLDGGGSTGGRNFGGFSILTISPGVTATVSGLSIAGGGNGTQGSVDGPFSRPFAGLGGGAINNTGNLTLQDCSLIGNVLTNADGGAIYNTGTLTVNRTAFGSNGVSLFTGNETGFEGGAIANLGTLNVTNSTFYANNSGTQAGGGAIYSTGTLTLAYSTFGGNSGGVCPPSASTCFGSGGGINIAAGTASADSTLFNSNHTPGQNGGQVVNDCSGLISSGDYNLLSNGQGCTLNGTHSILYTISLVDTLSTQISALAFNYSGPSDQTQTLALPAGSPAIDKGNGATCPATDQRGITRPQGPACDIGAFELAPVVNAAFTITASAGAGGSISPSSAVSVSSGGSQVFAIIPNSGFHIVDVLVDGSSVGPVVSYTFPGVTANHTISASFALDSVPTSTSINAPTITYNANGSVTVTVSSTAGTPTGNVSLSVDGGTAVSQALSGGSAVFTITSPNAGSHGLSASYTALGNFAASSNTGTLQVNPAPSSTSINAPTITYNANGSVTVTVSSTAGTPTGNVSLSVDGGTAVSQALSGGSAMFTITSPNAGSHGLSASYTALGNFAASSNIGTLQVNPAAATPATIVLSNLVHASDGTPKSATATTTPGFCGPAAITYNGSPTPPVKIGSYAVVASVTNRNCIGSNATGTLIIFAYASGGGSFVIGDLSSAVPKLQTFWGAQWAKSNSLSGGTAPSSFKGFANQTGSTPARCGGTWTTSTGNSSGPPATIPAYMAVIVSSSIAQSGSTVAGDIKQIVVVQTTPGYSDNPGHPGTGLVVARVCP